MTWPWAKLSAWPGNKDQIQIIPRIVDKFAISVEVGPLRRFNEDLFPAGISIIIADI